MATSESSGLTPLRNGRVELSKWAAANGLTETAARNIGASVSTASAAAAVASSASSKSSKPST